MRADERRCVELERSEAIYLESRAPVCSTVRVAHLLQHGAHDAERVFFVDAVIEWREITDYYFKTDTYDELRSRIEPEGTPSVQTIHKTRSSNEIFLQIPPNNAQMWKYVSSEIRETLPITKRPTAYLKSPKFTQQESSIVKRMY